jgi:hypothetical protein
MKPTRRTHVGKLTALPLLAAFLAACGTHSPLESSRDLGALPFLEAIWGRDGGYSAFFGGRSVWVFGDTPLRRQAADGLQWRSSTWSWTRDADASDGIGSFDEQVDEKGEPYELMPFTADEAAFNAAHLGDGCRDDCGAQWRLWPGPIVVDPATGAALLFYGKIIARPGSFNFSGVGQSIATWAGPDVHPVRPETRPGAAEPTLLFPDGEPQLGSAALLHEGQVYAYACESSWIVFPCKLARAPFERALERSAWRFFTGSTWSEAPKDARSVMYGAPMMTVHWNAHLHRFVAFHIDSLAGNLVMHLADRPEGPWTEAMVLARARPTGDVTSFPYGALAHPELSREGGKVEYLSYTDPSGAFGGEMRFVEIRFR